MRRPSLITLGELLAHGLIAVSVLDLPDVDLNNIRSRSYRDFVASTWSEGSPRARALGQAAPTFGRGLKP